jgi:predicted nucleotidyltransferase
MDPRTRVAIEAARLMYHGRAKEYIDAKEQAAASLGVNTMPSNFEVAIELDRYAQEVEGSERYQRLIEMRKAALKTMRLIGKFDPRLTGSVWRGTARESSDIDIIVFHDDPQEIRDKIRTTYEIDEMETEVFQKNGLPCSSTHIRIQVDKYPLEIVVRPLAEKELERCEIYGDIKRGVTLHELEKLIISDPLRRFIPRRRV